MALWRRATQLQSSITTIVVGLMNLGLSRIFGGPRQQWAWMGLAVGGAAGLLDFCAIKIFDRTPVFRRALRVVIHVALAGALYFIYRRALSFPPSRTGPFQ